MKRRLLPALLATVALAAQADDSADKATPEDLPNQDLTPAILYQFLLAEIAGGRGEVGLASEAYFKLAEATRDPRIARRAAEIALYSQRQDIALAAARLWVEVDPQSMQAKQMMTGLLAAVGRPEELAAHITQQLATAGTNIGPLLMQLNRILARQDDKLVVQRLVDQVTEPYLGIAEAHFARAQAAHGAGDKTAALAEIDRALVLRPDWEHAVLVRVQLMADTTQAATFLRAFVAANPNARDARLAYARALVGERSYGAAREQFDLLLAGSRDDADIVYAVAVLSIQLNDLDRAESQFKDLIAGGYTESNSARAYLGQIAEERKRWDEALTWYERVTAGDQYLAARMRAAHVLAHQQKLAEARVLLQESVATNVDERDQLLIFEAQMLRDAGRAEDAYTVLEGGLALRPDQPDLLYEAALTAEKTGKNDVLERNLRRLIEIKPDHAHAYNALGYSLADRNVRLDEAQRLIDKALQLAPDDPFILDSKGWILFRRGDGTGALDVLRKAFAIRADPEIAAHVGEVLWSLGRQEEAKKTWAEAIKTSPDNEALAATMKRFGKP
jgi:tetratricopeptide (TPR) repeat protein